MVSKKNGSKARAAFGIFQSEGLWVSLLLFAYTLLVAWQQMRHPELMPMTAADTGIHYPFKVYWIKSILEGHPALWNPYLAMGVPFVAHPSVAAFSPFNLIFLLLHDHIPYAFALENFLHVWIAALGIYAVLRAWGCRWEAGALAGIAFAFQAFFNTHHWFGQFSMPLAAAWIPWVLFFLDRAIVNKKLAWLVAASACSALSFFEGYPQIAYYGLMFSGMYLLARFWRRPLEQQDGILVAAFFLGLSLSGYHHGLYQFAYYALLFLYLVLTGWWFRTFDLKSISLMSIIYIGSFFLLIAGLLLPFMDFTQVSNRSEWGYDFIMSDFQVPNNVNYFLQPFYAGNPLTGTYSEEGRWSYTESAVYVGVIPFLMFVGGLFFLGGPSKLYAWVSSLALLGMMLLMGRSTSPLGGPSPAPWGPEAGIVPLLLLVVGIYFMAKKWKLYAWLSGTALLFYLLAMGRSSELTNRLFRFFYDTVPGFGMSRSISRMNILVTLCIVLCAGLALDHLIRNYLIKSEAAAKPRRKRGFPLYWIVPLILIITGYDLWHFSRGFFVPKPYGFLEPHNIFPGKVMDELLNDKSLPRIQPMNWVNSNILFKISQVKGSDMMLLKEASYYRQRMEEDYDNPLSDVIRLKYLQTSDEKLAKGGRWRVGQKDYYLVYVNDQALPRCFLVGRAVAVPDPRSAVMTLKQGWSDPKSQVLIIAPSVPFQGDPGYLGEAEMVEYRDTQITMRCKAPRPCYLFLSDLYYKDWEAQVDGKPVPIYEANGPFRAVFIPTEGEHEVKMVFRPVKLYLGLMISFPAWLLLGALWIWGRGVKFGWPETLLVWVRAIFRSDLLWFLVGGDFGRRIFSKRGRGRR